MSSIPTMKGITAQTISTPRLSTRALFSGPDNGIPVLFVHGNASSAPYWEEVMLALPAGSGGGIVNPTFTQMMAAGDRGSDNPQASPRIVMNSFYWKPPFKAAREEELLSSLLSEHVGPDQYPGDMTPSDNWPNVAPGVWGPANALSPKYCGDITRLY